MSAGQLGPLPGQFSGRSHSPAATRQTVLEEAKPSAGQVALAPLPHTGSGDTDQPLFGRLSSRILPLKVSGYPVPDDPPALWKPMVALCPLALALIVLRYLTSSTLERSWICTCPFTLSAELAT